MFKFVHKHDCSNAPKKYTIGESLYLYDQFARPEPRPFSTAGTMNGGIILNCFLSNPWPILTTTPPLHSLDYATIDFKVVFSLPSSDN